MNISITDFSDSNPVQPYNILKTITRITSCAESTTKIFHKYDNANNSLNQ